MAEIENIKPEIKVDPASSTPNLADIDEYEDDFTLEIPNGGQAWLVKLPKEMWQAWKDVYDHAPEDTPIEIGKMRVFNPQPGEDDPLKQKIQIRLHESIPQHSEIPKNYDLKLSTQGYKNTLVFQEKDLPGHKPVQVGGRSRQNLQAGGRPQGIRSKNERYAGNKYRTAIPKETRLMPMVHHEARADPIQDEAYERYFQKQWNKSIQPKIATQYIEGVDRAMHPGMSNLSTFSSFGLSARPGGATAGKKKAAPKEKAVRMEQQDLLDALYKCFRRYRYWSLKALRNELKQPEQYIKSTLESIATMIKSGDFAMTYMLKPEYQSLADVKDEEVKEEAMKVESGVDTDGGDDEMGEDDADDVGDFEDVKMEGGGGTGTGAFMYPE